MTTGSDAYVLVPLRELYDHADGNVGAGCWALYEKYAQRQPVEHDFGCRCDACWSAVEAVVPDA